jgi:hypothetical protein
LFEELLSKHCEIYFFNFHISIVDSAHHFQKEARSIKLFFTLWVLKKGIAFKGIVSRENYFLKANNIKSLLPISLHSSLHSLYFSMCNQPHALGKPCKGSEEQINKLFKWLFSRVLFSHHRALSSILGWDISVSESLGGLG